MHADQTVHEPRPTDDPDTPLAYSMEGYAARTPGPLITRFWWPGWNSAQAVNKFQQEINGPLYGGSGGKRLVRPSDDAEVKYFDDVSEPVRPAGRSMADRAGVAHLRLGGNVRPGPGRRLAGAAALRGDRGPRRASAGTRRR